jgi:alkanesulfonate monooxygenase SsuD/methylene tetrahydromethanopterin reductase-like flavin-dependent oxidoreductase (luciferase family)
MKFGVFYEQQLPRPWKPDSEVKIFQDSLDQVELADRLGWDYAWAVEHHFLEEYAHSSAPEIFLAACSQRTKQIRLGHGIVALPPAYNPPARVAERIAALDLVSRGRVEFGTGETSADSELMAYGVPRAEKHAMWLEALEVVARMLAEEPFRGHEGKYINFPVRNIVPKPVQKPHPPLWMACSRLETIKLAAKLGIGALTFGFFSPEEARKWTAEYYRILENECEPIGEAINANIAFTMMFLCNRDAERACRLGKLNSDFFIYSFGHHYIFGEHEPGKTSIHERFSSGRIDVPAVEGTAEPAFGTPEDVTRVLRTWEDCGVDQIMTISQSGNQLHEDICESIDLVGRLCLPEFKERDEKRQKAKAARLEPIIEKAMKRKKAPRLPKNQGPTIIKAVGGIGTTLPKEFVERQ